MSADEKLQFIQDTILGYRDTKLTLKAAAHVIYEALTPKPLLPAESLEWARGVIAEHDEEQSKSRQCDWCLIVFPKESLAPADCGGIRYCRECQAYYDKHGEPPPKARLTSKVVTA